MKTIVIIFFVILSYRCMAQDKEDLKRFEHLFAENTQKHKWGEQLKDNKNELSFIFSTAFVVYKEIFSSQDIDACVFSPSCSVYAVESIKQEGIIKGYFNAIDRLTRCNPGPKKDMPVDLSTGKYFDPVEPVPSGHKSHKVSQSHVIPVDK
jgi:putative component of membrane protein insertase Oxa1/YidC/SpoIIIJ protein YidD